MTLFPVIVRRRKVIVEEAVVDVPASGRSEAMVKAEAAAGLARADWEPISTTIEGYQPVQIAVMRKEA